jgi:hypothetical protein
MAHTETTATPKGDNMYLLEYLEITLDGCDNAETFCDSELVYVHDASVLRLLPQIKSKESFWTFCDMLSENNQDLYDESIGF